jgi:Family of unknown function (DUF6573)
MPGTRLPNFSASYSGVLLLGSSWGASPGKEVNSMTLFDDADVISTYTLQQAIEDGVLVEIFKNRWKTLSAGKPIVATGHLFNEVSLAGLLEIWNEYVAWRKNTEPKLPEEKRLFTTTMNDQKVWVLEDGEAFTLLYPEDY